MLTEASLDLRSSLLPVARYMRWNHAVKASIQTLFGVTVVWLVAYVVSRFILLPGWTLPALLTAGVLVVLIMGVLKAVRSATISDAARLVDQKLNLKERLSTVCELDSRRDSSEVASLLRKDAAKHLGKVVPSQLVSINLPRVSRWILLILLTIFCVSFLPVYQFEKQMQKQTDKEAIKVAGQRIELLARRVAENPTLLTHPEAPEDLKKISEMGKLLSSGSLAKNEALRELTKVTDSLKNREQSLESRPESKPLSRESMKERQSMSPEQMQALQSQMDKLQEKLGKNPTSEKQIRKLEKAIKQAREIAKNAKMGSPEGQALADSLSQSMAEANGAQLSQVAEALQKAIGALEKADTGLVLKNLDDAVVDLDQAKQNIEALNNLMKQASEAGKNLAEQLERGQTKLAQQTLENFKKQVDQAALTPEQKQQLVKELQKALGPAGDYGKLAEYLKDSMNQSDNQMACSQSLQKAIDELQQMAQKQNQQMQLAQMINELQRAGMMMNGQCAECDGMCMNPGFKPGGKPGSGVGTWPEYNGDPTFTKQWDNSGIERPDMVPRGQSDRGEPELPQGTQTMKLTGQMGSGGPMPGIRLQGVSIKGESNVKMEETFSAAAQEAESALTKETVPTAYQGTVKEYFDLK